MASIMSDEGPYGFTFTLTSRTSSGVTPSPASSPSSNPPWATGSSALESVEESMLRSKGHERHGKRESGCCRRHRARLRDLRDIKTIESVPQSIVPVLRELDTQEPRHRGHQIGRASSRERGWNCG